MNNLLEKKIHLNRHWIFLIAGIALGWVLSLLTLRQIYCFYTYEPGGAVLINLLGALSLIIGIVVTFRPAQPRNTKKPLNSYRDYFFAVCGLVLSIWVTVFAYPLVFPIEKTYCVDGYAQLQMLIEQEEKAVLTDDMAAIQEIYANGAIITRTSTGNTWPFFSYYKTKFETEEHCSIVHGAFTVVSFSSAHVVLTTSSQGTWGPKGKGCTNSYQNPPGSDRWTFTKVDGTWKIIGFEFN